MTLDELVLEYEDAFKHTNKIGTIATYHNCYRRYIQPYFGNVDITTISVKQCLDWWKTMIKAKTIKGTYFSKNSLNGSMRSVFNIYMNYAYRMNYININPALSMQKYKTPNDIPKKLDNFWELSEFDKFIRFVDVDLYRYLFYILFFTGLRIGEALSLTWNDVYFSTKKINIDKTIRYISPEIGYLISSPKTVRSVRVIEISNNTMKILLTMYNKQNENKNFKNSDFVFGGKTFLRYSIVRQRFKEYIKIANVKNISIHGLRHSHASFLINSKLDDYLIAERLGHSINELRNTYAHIYSIKRQNFYETLNNLEKELNEICYQNKDLYKIYN